jgi:predicted PurR-regulated permease PerM
MERTSAPTVVKESSSAQIPREYAEAVWRRASQVGTIGIFVIALMWAMHAAQHVLMPIVLAWSIATIVLPIVKGLERLFIPRAIAAIIVATVLLLLLALLIGLLSARLVYWLERGSQLDALVREKLQAFTQPLALLEQLRAGLDAISSGSSQPLKVDPQSSSIANTLVSVITPAISQFVIFVGSLLFYLVYQQKVRSARICAARPARSSHDLEDLE